MIDGFDGVVVELITGLFLNRDGSTVPDRDSGDVFSSLREIALGLQAAEITLLDVNQLFPVKVTRTYGPGIS